MGFQVGWRKQSLRATSLLCLLLAGAIVAAVATGIAIAQEASPEVSEAVGPDELLAEKTPPEQEAVPAAAPAETPGAAPVTLPSIGRPEIFSGSAPGPGIVLSGPGASNPARPHEGKAATEPVDIHYEGVELGQIIRSIGAQTGRNFLFDPQVAAIPVTLISHGPIDPEMLLPLLQSILVTYGFSMRETLEGNLIKIRPLAEDAEKAKIYKGPDAVPTGYEEFSTHVIPIRYAKAEELAQLLPRLASKDAKVDAYGPTNTLILSDNAHGIRNMLSFISEIDVEGSEIVMELFPLQYARAEVLATLIQDILLGTPTGGAPGAAAVPRPPTPTPVRPVRPGVPGQVQQTIIGAEEPELRMVFDERLNILIAMAPESIMKRVRELIEELDTPATYEMHNMHVYQLQNADAETVKEKLGAITGTTPRMAEGGRGGGPGAGISAEVQPFEKKVVIESYEPTNSLLIVASPQDYAVIKQLIAQLDVPQRQVHVEAVIMEVAIQDRFELAVELASLSAEDGFAVNNVVTLANILASGPLSAIGAEGSVLTAGILDGVMDIPVPTADGGFTIQTVPKIPLLLTALDSITDLDVLSQPLITTVDNEQAKITIGEEVPIVRGTSTSLDQAAVGRSIFSQVERRDVGIMMSVKPQISAGDYVALELEVEVSQPKQSEVGADPNIVGLTLQKSQVSNKIVIRDGSTGVVGGLISETTDHSVRKAPYLGDVPVLGWLFRRKTDRRMKRNLVILLTPYVIKEGVDADRIREYRVKEFASANVDVLFEKGYIKRIQRRHYMRTQYRPTAAKVGRVGEGGFERGSADN